MMMQSLLLRVPTQVLTCLVIVCGLSQTTRAAEMISDPFLQVDTEDSGAPADMVVGFQFTATTDIILDGLGWTDAGDGVQQQSHTIGLWQLDGTLLTSAVVTPFSPLTSTLTRTESITPVSLSSGSTYVLGGTVEQFVSPGESDTFGHWSGGGSGFPEAYFFTAVVDPRVTFDGSRRIFSSSLEFPTAFGAGDTGYIGPNAQFAATPVPEPTSIALFGTGLIGMAGARWRRRRRGQVTADGPALQDD